MEHIGITLSSVRGVYVEYRTQQREAERQSEHLFLTSSTKPFQSELTNHALHVFDVHYLIARTTAPVLRMETLKQGILPLEGL